VQLLQALLYILVDAAKEGEIVSTAAGADARTLLLHSRTVRHCNMRPLRTLSANVYDSAVARISYAATAPEFRGSSSSSSVDNICQHAPIAIVKVRDAPVFD
jgi:hypothetical protein